MKVTTVLSTEYQKIHPKADGVSVGAIRHYKTPREREVSEQTYDYISKSTAESFTLEDGKRVVTLIPIVTITKAEKPKKKVKKNG